MKKLSQLLAALIFVGFLAGNVLAATGDCTSSFSECENILDDNGGGPGIKGLKLSPNVQLAYNGDANAYALGTWNSSGTRAYAASSEATGVYVSKDEVTKADGITLPAASGEFASNDWVVLGK